MNDVLTQALASLHLQPGQCQCVQVEGYEVEIRRPAEEKSEFEEMVMLEPWTDFPRGESSQPVFVRRAPHPLPVSPEIPSDDQDAL